MKKDIERKCLEYSQAATPSYTNGTFDRYAISQAFEDGAEWRINSVWHDAKEKPADGEVILIVTDDNHPIICGPNNSDFFKNLTDLRMERWAYVSDLLPERKEETNGGR